MPTLTERIIAATFVSGDFIFADGTVANNKLVSERLARDPELLEEVVSGLAQLAMSFNPDLITFVPNGAKMFAKPVAEQLDLPMADLWKQSTSGKLGGRISYRTPKDRLAVLSNAVSRIVIIEDISRTFSSAERVVNLEGMDEKAVGLVSIHHRGTADNQEIFRLPVKSLSERYLPTEMEERELAEYDALAVELTK